MLENLRWFPVLPLARYPGYRHGEASIMSQFLRNNPLNLQRITFNTPLIRRPIPRTDKSLSVERDYQIAAAYKPDALAFSESEFYLIEVKLRPRAQAIFQTCGYISLYRVLFPESRQPQPVLLCYQCNPRYKRLARELNVQIIETVRSND